MRASEISSRLAARVDDLVRTLLPKGKRSGHEWRCGGINGDPGDSLGVHLSGEKAGVWADFATGESGDLIGLWMAVKRVSLADACKEALDYLGIQAPRRDVQTRAFSKPAREGVRKLLPEHFAHLRDSRKLPEISIETYKLASFEGRIMFPFLRHGELIAAKYRNPLDKRDMRMAKDCLPMLFGWQAIPENARAVIICEGEIDALSWHAYGFPALSVPNGASSHLWIENEFDSLAIFDTIYLSMDMDEAGQKSIPEIADRLGRERVRVVKLPAKDANECLQTGISVNAMIAALRDSRTLDPAELRGAHEFVDLVWQEFNRVDHGIPLPWKKCGTDILLRPGEVSVWAGINGHGKSEVIGHVTAASVFRGGVKACVASMEFAPQRWLKRMYRQVAAVDAPTQPYITHISKQTVNRLWVFDAVGTAKAAKILDVFAYAARRYGMQLFVIDNLAKCGFGEDDYNGQKGFVDALTDFARAYQVHVALVAHMRKGESEDKPSGKMSVKGTGAITDMVDTVFEIWRNKPREQKMRKLIEAGEPVPAELNDQASTLLLCHKQRNGEKEPRIALWFDEETHQFLAKQSHRALSMVEFTCSPVDTAMGNVA